MQPCVQKENIDEIIWELKRINDKLDIRTAVKLEEEIERRSIIEAEKIRIQERKRHRLQIVLSIIICILFFSTLIQSIMGNRKLKKQMNEFGVPIGLERGGVIYPLPPDTKVIMFDTTK